MPVLVLVCLLAGTSCVLRGPSDVRRDVSRATGARYERDFGLTLGRTSMAIARCGLRFAQRHSDEGDLSDLSLRGLRKVQVGVYHVRDDAPDGAQTIDPAAFGAWEPLVVARDEGENVQVLYRQRGGAIRAMLVVVQDDDDLVVVRMRGRLDELIEDTLRLALHEAGRDELYEPTMERISESEIRVSAARAEARD